jgi:hypothetical protein
MANINLHTSGEGSTAQRPLSILFGVNANREYVSTYSRAVLKSIMRAAGVHTVTITSSFRDAHDQARVMVGNIESKGVKHQKKLYRKKPGSRVVDLYVREKAAIEEANRRGYDTGLQTAYAKQRHLIRVLEDEISSIGQDKVSKHSSLQAILNVFDVAPKALVPHSKAIEELFIKAALKDARVTRLLYPPEDPAFHFEIAQLGDFPLSPESSVIA